jgi:hypothetical protein
VNHLVPNIYAKAVAAMHSLQAASTALSPNAALIPQVEEWWGALLAEALSMPSHHRGRYQALNTLLPYMGASKVLAAQTDVVSVLVSAVGTRDIAAAASGFLSSLLGELYASAGIPNAAASSSTTASATPAVEGSEREAVLSKLRNTWCTAVISALCSETDAKFRLHVAEYLLPELLKVDTACVPHVVQTIRSSDYSLTCQLWGMVNFALQARLRDLPGHVTGDDGGVREQELYLACVSADSELRLAGLTCLVSSCRTAAALEDADMRTLRSTLRHSLKDADADHRHKLVRISKALFLRLSESSRAAERDIVKLEAQIQFAAAKASSGDSKLQPAPAEEVVQKGNEGVQGGKKHKSRKVQQQLQAAMSAEGCQQAITTARGAVQASYDCCAFVAAALLDNLYPGASCDREVMSLDLLGAMLEAMGADSPQMRAVYSDHMVRTLINLFISSWDRSRRMAADLLLQLPRPLAGYVTRDSAAALLRWGLELAGSAKLRESDAGALLVRDIYMIYASDLQWDLSSSIWDISAARNAVDDKVEGSVQCCGAFVSALCDRWGGALSKLEEVFTAYNLSALLSSNQQYPYQPVSGGTTVQDVVPAGTLPAASFPLCHGVLLSIRLCLSESHKARQLDDASSGSASVSPSTSWRPVVSRIYQYAMQSLKLAMTVVAEAPSDVLFAPVPLSSKGPVNAATAVGGAPSKSMAASYINTNSTMGTGAAEGEEGSEAGATAQRAVVAAWLLVKESASLLSLLVGVSPPAGEGLLTDAEVAEAGWVILDALGRLKHMGAISEAQLALQSIATTLLRYATASR